MAYRTDLSPSIPPPGSETVRTIALGEHTVAYVLRRARRKTIGLSVDHRGLRVGAPQAASLREVESLILRHGAWVCNKLEEWRLRPMPERLPIVDGLRLPILGGSVRLVLALGANRCLWSHLSGNEVLTLCLRTPAEAPRLLERALRDRARECFGERLRHYAPLLGVELPPLSLSSARTRWGSCSRRGGVRLNWRLIHFPPAVVDYVVVHELAHVREMNHSARFWSIVERLYPEYRTAREQLKTFACPSW